MALRSLLAAPKTGITKRCDARPNWLPARRMYSATAFSGPRQKLRSEKMGLASSPCRGFLSTSYVNITTQIVQRLQHYDLELQDRIVGLATGVALALLELRLGHPFDVSAEVLPRHDLLDRL